MAALKERGVGTLIHYPIPLHLQPAFASPAASARATSRWRKRAAGEILSLPLYPQLTDVQARTVARAVRAAAERLA